jgi:hypothetical protein
MSARPALTAIGLGAVLLVAAALRLHGIHWGLPDAVHPGYSWHADEGYHIGWALRLAAGDPLPANFIYGGTLYYSMLNGYVALGSLLEPWLDGFNPLANVMLVGRYAMVLVSLLGVALTYATGRLLFDRATALLAAAIVGASPAHVFLTGTVRPDETAALLAIAFAWLAAWILRSGSARTAPEVLLIGAASGIALALRFPTVLFAAAPVAAWLWRDRPAGVGAAARLLLPRLLVIAPISALAYCVASPHSLMAPDMLLAGLRGQWLYQSGVFADAIGQGPGLYQYGWLQLAQALGTPLHVLALGGVALALARRDAPSLLLLAAVVPYLLLTSVASWVLVRYVLPLVPLLALLAAAFVVAGARIASPLRRAFPLAAAVALAWTLAADTAFARVQAGPNPRELASYWMTRDLPPDAAVVTVQPIGDSLYGPPHFEHLYVFELMPGAEVSLLADGYDVVVIAETLYRPMDRLRDTHPMPEAIALQGILEQNYALAAEIRVPVALGPLAFNRNFTSLDYTTINPGIRIYRRHHARVDSPTR